MKKKAGIILLSIAVLFLLLILLTTRLQQGGNGHNTGNGSGATERGYDLTILTPDVAYDEFRSFISDAEKKLNMRIRLVATAQDAESREAQVSNYLTSGKAEIDLITINDEMASEFIPKGYLEPIGKDTLPDEIRESYPETYFDKVCTYKGKVYSVPYYMDVMMFWVNQKFLDEAGVENLDTQENVDRFLDTDFGDDRYPYGSAWEQSYAYNDLFQHVNLFGGDYLNWKDEESRRALWYLRDLVMKGRTPEDQVMDQYDQMEQKFIEGRYGCMYLYSGGMNILLNSGRYSEEELHISDIPSFYEKKTIIATWQFAVNHASPNKEAAMKFIKYVSGDEGAEKYSNDTHRAPARLDILNEKTLDIPDIDLIRDYTKKYELLSRHMTTDPMSGIKDMGNLFQRYVGAEITMEEFCEKAQKIVDS